jgi:acetamidase/formamidase
MKPGEATCPAAVHGDEGPGPGVKLGVLTVCLMILVGGCSAEVPGTDAAAPVRAPDFVLTNDQTHTKFSRRIAPAVRVPSGSILEVFTHEATGGQLHPGSTIDALPGIDMDRVHTLTGPVYVEGAEPGDVLAVRLLDLEPANWGWMAIEPDFGLLAGEFETTVLQTFALDTERGHVEFAPGLRIPLKPFAGVMGVAPDTDEMLDTIPPRANGGNLDDPNLVAGTTVYFPVFVAGGLFSIGDGHAVQGLGEVSGTAMETPMRIVYEISVIKGGRSIAEPQYETDDYYATTGFGTTIDEAAKKATRYMIEYLTETRGLSREQAYMLCSLAGDLKIAEAVDVPHMLVTMHMAKHIFVEP